MQKRHGGGSKRDGGSRERGFAGKVTKNVDRMKEIEEQLRLQRATAASVISVKPHPAAHALEGYTYDEKTDRYFKGEKAQSQPDEPIRRKNHEKDNLLSFLRHRETGTRYSSEHYELLSIAHFVTLAENS